MTAEPSFAGPERASAQPDTALLSALTTEHFTLQTARSATIAESSSRATLFLGTLTGTVVALAFVGQVSRSGPAFVLFALTLLPTTLLLGLLTYVRLVQSSIEDVTYARAINRIRAYYRTLSPDAEAYLLMSPAEHVHGVLSNAGMRRSRYHLLGHAATMVAVVDAVLGGATAGVALELLAGASTVTAGAVGVATAVVTLVALLVHQAGGWTQAVAHGDR